MATAIFLDVYRSSDSLLRLRHHGEVAVMAVHSQHALKQPQLQFVVLCRLPVILQRLDAHGLFRRANQRQVADFQQFRSREEHHVDRVVVNRVAQAALVDHQRPHSRALRLDGAGQPGGPAPIK